MSTPSNRRSGRDSSIRLSVCGMLAALGTVLLSLGTMLFPDAAYAMPLMCSILLLMPRIEYGTGTAWSVYGVTAVLSLLLGADREASLFYALLGWYPIMKWALENRVKGKWLRLACKLGIFYLCMLLLLGATCLLLGSEAVLAEFALTPWMPWLLAVIYGISMLLFDWLLMPMATLYATRLRPKLMKKR